MRTEKYYVERMSFGVQAMVILLSLSAAFRLIGCWGLWNDRTYALLQIVLPILSALLLIACVWFLGRRALWLSFIPVTLGAVFFIIEAISYESRILMIISVLFCIAVIAVWFCTVFGILRTRWVAVLLFGIPFLYHVFAVDLAALRDSANPVSFSAGMQEMGTLCVLLGMFFLSLSIHKTEKPEIPLPKMRTPKVIPEEKEAEAPSDQEELAEK